jgi:hypothetical protein
MSPVTTINAETAEIAEFSHSISPVTTINAETAETAEFSHSISLVTTIKADDRGEFLIPGNR